MSSSRRAKRPDPQIGEVYSVEEPPGGCILVHGVTDYEPIGVMGFVIAANIGRPMLLDLNEIGDPTQIPGPFVLEHPSIEIYAASHSVSLEVRLHRFEWLTRVSNPYDWYVAGQGDIHILELTLVNRGNFPVGAHEILQQVCLRDGTGSRFPPLWGQSIEVISRFVVEPRALMRFGHGGPPLLPNLPATGMLAFLVAPTNSGWELRGL